MWSEMFVDQGNAAASDKSESKTSLIDRSSVDASPGLISISDPQFETSKTLKLQTPHIRGGDTVSIKDVPEINEKHAALTLLEAKFSKSNNVVLLDRTLTLISGKYIFEAVSTVSGSRSRTSPEGLSDQMVGFILSVEHSLRLRLNASDVKIISTGLTTNLTVHPEFRKAALAMHLIRAVIQKGYGHGVYCGYHFTNESHSKSAVKIVAWYRILDAKKAYDFGYRTRSTSSDFSVLQNQYRIQDISIGWSIRPTVYSDMVFLDASRRKLTIGQVTPEQWTRLSGTPLRWFSLEFEAASNKVEIRGVAAIRPFIVYLADTKKICTAAQLVFFEAADLNAAKQLSNLLLGALTANGYVVLHGVSLGWICQLEDYLKCVRTGSMWLDFYNLRLPSSRPEELSVLYI